MLVGSVYYWETENVRGYERRPKYHVFIRHGDWQFENVFLFINKSDYGGDYPLSNVKPHDFLTLPVSYVGCGAIIEYPDDDIEEFNSNPVGRLSYECLRGVYQNVQSNAQMPGGEKKMVLEALYEYLKKTS